MNTVLIISKKSCGPCTALMNQIRSLSQEIQEKISVLDESTSSLSELVDIANSYDSSGFPTIVLKRDDNPERVITGFGLKTLKIITDHVAN